MLTAKDVKKMAREYGADTVGIASMDRFAGTKRQDRVIFRKQELYWRLPYSRLLSRY